LPSNANLTVSIRPERLAIANSSAANGLQGELNHFAGSVKDVFFLGDHVRLTVNALGQDNIVAQIPARDIRGFAVGEKIEFVCRADDCRLLGA
jgi:putative spermidine/putrescine transport system ATP-binding protein